jgi:hypothetical protein
MTQEVAEVEDTAVVAALKAIAARSGGELTPEEIVAEAETLPEDHPLHQSFEWNDGLAAHAHRLHQARSLLNRYRLQIVITSSTRAVETVRAPLFIRHPEAEPHEQRYIATSRLRHPDQREVARAAVVDAYKRASTYLTNARHLAVVLGQADLVAQDVERLAASRQRIIEAGPRL